MFHQVLLRETMLREAPEAWGHNREEETPELCSLPVLLTGTQAPSPLE